MGKKSPKRIARRTCKDAARVLGLVGDLRKGYTGYSTGPTGELAGINRTRIRMELNSNPLRGPRIWVLLSGFLGDPREFSFPWDTSVDAVVKRVREEVEFFDQHRVVLTD